MKIQRYSVFNAPVRVGAVEDEFELVEVQMRELVLEVLEAGERAELQDLIPRAVRNPLGGLHGARHLSGASSEQEPLLHLNFRD